MKILTAIQMAEVDRLSSEVYKIPSFLLMENAGRAVADELEKAQPGLVNKRIYVFCGKGNNGGDGLVAARYLALRGNHPEVFLFSEPSKLKGDALTNWEIVCSLGLEIHVLSSAEEWRAHARKLPTPDVIVDALFGTGLSKPVGPGFKRPIHWINSRPGVFVLSVDIPSGLFADSSRAPAVAVRANLTVTFTALKLALVMPPSADFAGKVVLAPIGSPPALLENSEYRMELIDPAHVQRALPPRRRESHKGNYGHVFVLAGSRGKSGAALMTGLGALRSGAGLVTVWLPKGLQRDVAGKVPELMTESLPETSEGTTDVVGGEKLLQHAKEANALVVGPGMTVHRNTQELIRTVVRRSPVPVILDADGINAFAGKPELLANDSQQPIVITPHPGEMGRLLGLTVARVQADRLVTAQDFARRYGVFVILKGFQTIVSTPSGQVFINPTGNPGMATGGSGDILAGIVARFLAAWNRRYHGVDFRALADSIAAAVYLHGLAGDLAAEEKGVESLIATDLLGCLPQAFKRVAQ